MIMDRVASQLAGFAAIHRPLAIFRNACSKPLPATWHMCGSNIVSGVVLWFAVRILLHYAGHPPLRESALWMLGFMFVQMFLGIAAYMNRIAIDPRHGQCSGIPLP